MYKFVAVAALNQCRNLYDQARQLREAWPSF
jgi:hypothetical protein